MRDVFRSFIRISAFLRKEIFEVMRQPRLVATLVLGPFLILLLFGIGFRQTNPPLRALFVVEPANPFRQHLEEYVTSISPLLLFAGVTDELGPALSRLRADDVDVVIELPERPYETVRESERAVFILYHDEIDPYQAEYIEVFGRVYIDELNRRVLTEVTLRAQQEGGDLQESLGQARQNATFMRQALQTEDLVAARRYHRDLNRTVGLVALALATDAEFLRQIGQTFGNEEGDQTAEALAILRRIQEDSAALGELEDDQADYEAEMQQVAQIEEELTQLETTLVEFRSIAPQVLISPFSSETRRVGQVPLRLTDFYTPAVIALLVQHIAVTFAALSIVRERSEGALDLFRVSPLSPFELLLGKYASYFFFEAILAMILTALIVFGLGTPMLGSWVTYALILAALVLASLGFGFVISLAAQTTTQAVQYSMIVLLASIFFSGFFLALHLLWAPVRIVSWLLPVTYAIQMLQNVMLRGIFTEVDMLLSLTAIGLAFFVIAWLLMRRQMTQQ